MNKFDKNGVYQFTFPTCLKKYIGQTGRPFQICFREHHRDDKYANNKSKFAQHVLEEGHSFGPINEIMDTLHVARKGRMLDTLERFYIYRETHFGNQINYKLTVQSNPVVKMIVQNPPCREY
jgi:hypothetical protein